MKHRHYGRLIIALFHKITGKSLFSVGCFLVVLCNLTPLFAQSGFQDVIYLKNGEVRRGMIIEEVPNVQLKMQTADGNVFVYTVDEIERKTKEPTKVESAVVDKAPFASSAIKLENWYTYWGIGYSNPVYHSELKLWVDDCYSCDRVSMGLDLFGFYVPLANQKTIVGFVWNGAGDRYSTSNGWVQLMSSQWSISGMHFIDPGIGKGPFVRTDIGYGIFNAVNKDGDEPLKDEAESGLSILVGSGYGVPFGQEGGTRILFSANFAFRPGAKELYFRYYDYPSDTDRRVRGEGKVRVFSFTVGLLFYVTMIILHGC